MLWLNEFNCSNTEFYHGVDKETVFNVDRSHLADIRSTDPSDRSIFTYFSPHFILHLLAQPAVASTSVISEISKLLHCRMWLSKRAVGFLNTKHVTSVMMTEWRNPQLLIYGRTLRAGMKVIGWWIQLITHTHTLSVTCHSFIAGERINKRINKQSAYFILIY